MRLVLDLYGVNSLNPKYACALLDVCDSTLMVRESNVAGLEPNIMRLVERHCSDEWFNEYSDVEEKDKDDRVLDFKAVTIRGFYDSLGIADWSWEAVYSNIEWLIESFGSEEISGLYSKWVTIDIPDDATDYRIVRCDDGYFRGISYVVDGKHKWVSRDCVRVG